MNKLFGKQIIRYSLLCYIVFFFYAVAAQESTTQARYYLVHDSSELKDGTYLMVAIENNDQYYMMSGEASPAKKGKLKATHIAAPKEVISENVATKNQWFFQFINPQSINIKNAANLQYLNAHPKKRELLLSNHQEEWPIRYFRNNRFLIITQKDTKRCISTWITSEGSNKSIAYFGIYMIDTINANSTTLLLYKKGNVFEHENGIQQSLLDKKDICLSDGEEIFGVQQTINLNTNLLQGQKVAYQEDYQYSVDSITDKSFALTHENKYLQHDLTLSTEKAVWQIKNGFIIMNDGEDKYLISTNHKLHTLTLDELKTKSANPISSYYLADKPDSTIQRNTKVFIGGWNREKLANITFNDCQNINLTHAIIPYKAKPFNGQPSPNGLIYLSASQVPATHPSWKNIISEKTITSSLVLTDASPFIVDSILFADEGKIIYRRQINTEGNWETLCLPFHGNLPKNYQAEELVGRQGDKLIFSEVQHIRPNVPVIIRYIGKHPNTVEWLQMSNSQKDTITTDNLQKMDFIANFDTIKVQSSKENKYFLNENGSSFVLADKGSILYPFRSYLQLPLNNTVKTYRIKHVPLGISTTQISQKNKNIYDLNGRKSKTFPHSGVYIINHIKTYIP